MCAARWTTALKIVPQKCLKTYEERRSALTQSSCTIKINGIDINHEARAVAIKKWPWAMVSIAPARACLAWRLISNANKGIRNQQIAVLILPVPHRPVSLFHG